MTTNVTIDAHVSDSEEVRVKITDDGDVIEEFALQDGEQAIRYVYGDQELSVREVEK